MRKQLQLFVMLLSLGTMTAYSQADTTSAVRPLELRMEIADMYPQKYAARHNLGDFSLTLRADSAIVYLPYVGEVYTPVINDDGLNFSHKYSEMKVGRTKKGDAAVITFEVRHHSSAYQFSITAWPDRRASLVVSPSGADRCTYYGFLNGNIALIK